jgi:hypothetical protein
MSSPDHVSDRKVKPLDRSTIFKMIVDGHRAHHARVGIGESGQATKILGALNFVAVHRIFKRISNFHGNPQISFDGLVQLPNTSPWWLKAIGIKLEDSLISNLKHYLVIPYSPSYLLTLAMTDWIAVCKEHDDELEEFLLNRHL